MEFVLSVLGLDGKPQSADGGGAAFQPPGVPWPGPWLWRALGPHRRTCLLLAFDSGHQSRAGLPGFVSFPQVGNISPASGGEESYLLLEVDGNW